MRAECARAEACLPIGPIGQRLQQLLEILSVLLYFVQVAFHGFFVNRDARPHLGEGREHMCCSQRAAYHCHHWTVLRVASASRRCLRVASRIRASPCVRVPRPVPNSRSH